MKSQPWFDHYPPGVPREINPDRYPSLNELFDESFNKFRDLKAYESMGRVLTFGQVDRLSAAFAAFLQNDLQLKQGERIAIQLPNLLQWVVAMIGSIRAGLIVVNTNPLYTAREMEYQFRDAGVSAVVILSNFAANLERILPKVAVPHVIVTDIGDMLGGLRRIMVNFVVRRMKKMVPAFSIPRAIPFLKALSAGQKSSWRRPVLSGDDIAYLQYTGGTTGLSKGAMLSHRNLIANVEQLTAWIPQISEGRETGITALPLYHIYALMCNCLFTQKLGIFNVLIANPRDMPDFIRSLKKHKFSLITGVNTLYNALMNHKGFAALDFSCLKLSSAGGMALQDAVASRWKEITGIPLVEGYGLSETSPILACNPADGRERIGTVGLPFPSTHIIIVDEEGKEVEPGKPGEICARGPQVMKGYWNKEDETKEAFIGGYLRTGDIGVFESDGYLRIIDRKKEMINVSGLKVFPNEVENVIASYPKVLEVGAIGMHDPYSMEAVKVFVVKKDQSLTEKELIQYCRENLAPYKVPKSVEFRTELPKSNVGKILRRILREDEEAKAAVQA
jgi:long-chain acyl-CoA synthetase